MKNILLFLILSTLINACSSEPKERILDQKQMARYIGKASFMTHSAQLVLADNLKRAIREEGAPGAMEFCNVQAQPLTDSVSTSMSAMIKRVSDQPRNPLNKANESEIEYIEKIKTDLVEGNKLFPKAIQQKDRVITYFPIVTKGLCMQCHGDPDKTIHPETLAKINELYPEDKATGYSEGELRGIWVVEMDTTIHRLF